MNTLRYAALILSGCALCASQGNAQSVKPAHLQPALVPAAQQPAPARGNLQETLHKLDEASARFHSAQADFHKEQVVPPVPDAMITNGSTYVERVGKKVRMAAKLTGQDNETVTYAEGDVRIYKPGLNCYNLFSGQSNQGKIETFLTLGFGGSGTDLAKSWNITDEGPETLPSDGHQVKVEKLKLLPKENSVRDVVQSITLWIDLERGIALKQMIVAPSNGGTQTAVYSHIRLNEPIDQKPYAFSPKANVCH